MPYKQYSQHATRNYIPKAKIQSVFSISSVDLARTEVHAADRFLEPACGNGNFLIAVLRRKLADVKCRCENNLHEYERNAVIAVASLRGIDILEDNVLECRQRLFGFIQTEYVQLFGKQPDSSYLDNIRTILEQNIVCGNALTLFADGEC